MIREFAAMAIEKQRTSHDIDNVGLGVFCVIMFGLVPILALVVVCTTVYYCLKLFS